MHPNKRWFVGLNGVGGIAVLASYVYGVAAHPETRGEVWGGVPEALKPLYTTSMLLAALGYFPFTAFFLLRVDPEKDRFGRYGFGLITTLYAVVLVGSALWMPLTFRFLDGPGAALWWVIRLDLAAVGLASLGLLLAQLALRPAARGTLYWLAVAGLLAFCFQTAALDALIWPAFFPA